MRNPLPVLDLSSMETATVEAFAKLDPKHWRHVCRECFINEMAFRSPTNTIVFDMKADRAAGRKDNDVLEYTII